MTWDVLMASVLAIAAGAIVLAVVSAIGVVVCFWEEASERRESARNGCGRDACRHGCRQKRGGDGPPLRVFNDGAAAAFVRGEKNWHEIKEHFDGGSR